MKIKWKEKQSERNTYDTKGSNNTVMEKQWE